MYGNNTYSRISDVLGPWYQQLRCVEADDIQDVYVLTVGNPSRIASQSAPVQLSRPTTMNWRKSGENVHRRAHGSDSDGHNDDEHNASDNGDSSTDSDTDDDISVSSSESRDSRSSSSAGTDHDEVPFQEIKATKPASAAIMPLDEVLSKINVPDQCVPPALQPLAGPRDIKAQVLLVTDQADAVSVSEQMSSALETLLREALDKRSQQTLQPPPTSPQLTEGAAEECATSQSTCVAGASPTRNPQAPETSSDTDVTTQSTCPAAGQADAEGAPVDVDAVVHVMRSVVTICLQAKVGGKCCLCFGLLTRFSSCFIPKSTQLWSGKRNIISCIMILVWFLGGYLGQVSH